MAKAKTLLFQRAAKAKPAETKASETPKDKPVSGTEAKQSAPAGEKAKKSKFTVELINGDILAVRSYIKSEFTVTFILENGKKVEESLNNVKSIDRTSE